MLTTTAYVDKCPYCEHATPGAESVQEAHRRLATHVQTLHRDRLDAAKAYHQAVAAGRPTAEARALANAILKAAARGPGSYDRHAT